MRRDAGVSFESIARGGVMPVVQFYPPAPKLSEPE
jgi:hypothetical protein